MTWRKFLETPASGVDSYVVVRHDDDSKYPDATFKLSDCDRIVVLYFGLNGKRAVRRARRKLNGLREAVDRLEGIVSSYERTD